MLAVIAAAADFQAGYAVSGRAKALALADRHGHRAVILNLGFQAPLTVTDPIAAEVLKTYGLERAALLFRSVGSGDPAPRDSVAAIGASLGNMEPARIDFGQGLLQISTHSGCHALDENTFLAICGLALVQIKGTIRSAFQIVDLPRLLTRADSPRSCYVQAIALGNQVVILSAPENFLHSTGGRILAATPAVDENDQIPSAISEVLSRVGRK